MRKQNKGLWSPDGELGMGIADTTDTNVSELFQLLKKYQEKNV